jgi:hypothetical protein
MSVFPSLLFLTCEPLYTVPRDINQVSSAKSTLVGDESLKVDLPPSPHAEKTVTDSLKPSSPNGSQGSPGASGAPTYPTRAALD